MNHGCCILRERRLNCMLYMSMQWNSHVSVTCTCSTKYLCMFLQDNVRIEEVKLRRKYLNSGDVFILDLGLRAIQVGHVVMTRAFEMLLLRGLYF